MALISQNFLNDTQGNAISVIPVIVLADLDKETNKYILLDSFSTSNLYLKDEDDNKYTTREIIKSISSIKHSVDIEKRNLKINTFRFSIYNYYDVTKSLTSSESYSLTGEGNPLKSLIGKYVILYYKTPTTDTINLNQKIEELDNDNLSIMFVGIVSRTTQGKDTITIQGEDFTQDIIKETQVPKTKIGNLSLVVQNNLAEKDIEKPLPMVFGSVDKSPTLVYTSNLPSAYGLKSLVFIHDSMGISGRFQTSPLWNDFDSNPHLYIADGDDYLVFPYQTSLYKHLGKTYFLDSQDEQTHIVPELHNSEATSIYTFGYMYATQAISDLRQENLLTLDGTISQDEAINPDYEPLLAHYGQERKWYRFGELINTITDEDSFDFGHQVYPTSTAKGTGRWILVQFDKKEVIQGFRCYSKLYVDPNDTTATNYDPNICDGIEDCDTDDANSVNRHRVYIKPFNPDQFQVLFDSSLVIGSWVYTIYGDDPLSGGYTASGNEETFPAVQDTAQNLDVWETQDIRDNLGLFNVPSGMSYSFDLIGGGGLTHEQVKSDFEGSIPCDRMLLWEAYKGPGTPSHTIKCGGYMHSFSAKYLKEIEDYPTQKYYASISGRKDYTSTENIDNLQALLQEYDATWEDTILGADGLAPEYEGVVNAWDEYFRKKYIFQELSEYGNEWDELWQSFLNAESFKDVISHLSEPSSLNSTNYGVENRAFYTYVNGNYYGGEYEIPDFAGLGLDDSNLMKSNQVVSVALHGILRKFYCLLILKEINFLGWSAFWGGLDSPIATQMQSAWFDYYSSPDMNFYALGLLVALEGASGIFPSGTLLHIQNKINAHADVRRALIRRVLKYVYQNPLNTEDAIDSVLQDSFGAENFLYEWNSNILEIQQDGIVNIDNWVYNFKAYMNDTLYTAQTAADIEFIQIIPETIWIIQDESQYLNTSISSGPNDYYNSHLVALKFWDDDPLILGQAELLPFWGGFSAVQLFQLINSDSLMSECFTNPEAPFLTNGIVDKPIDIIINILSRELNFGIEGDVLNPNIYKQEQIQVARDFYSGWKMGFCIDSLVDTHKLISDICKETQSFFTFNPDSSFDLFTIKNRYSYDDIDYNIDANDIIKYKITRTKREDVIVSCKYFYRYDNGMNNYTFDTGVLSADILEGYDGYNYYNLDETIGYKEKNLRYHSDTGTAKLFQKFDLLNNCNQHLLIEFEASLSLSIVKVGDILHIPLINNDKAFGIDYSKVEILNGQPIYPLWIVTGTDIKLDKIIIKAYQLHYLNTDSAHGFMFPEEDTYEIVANVTNEFNTEFSYPNGDPIPNWNYLPEHQRLEGVNYIESGIQIPFGDITGDESINTVDIIAMLSMVSEAVEFTEDEMQRADINSDGIVNIFDMLLLTEIILY